MKELPRISTYLRKYGIKPLNKGFSDRYTIIGFDTETIGNDDITVDKDIYSMQLVKNNLNEQYFYLVSNDDVGIKMLDAKTEYGTYIFNRYSFTTAHNLEFDLGALLGNDFLNIIDYKKYKERRYQVKEGNLYYDGWKIKFNLGQSSFFEFKKRGTKLIFTDSRNWFKGSLDDIGKTFFKIRKKEKPSFLGIRPPMNDVEFTQFKDYAMQDAKIQFLLTKEIEKIHQDEDVPLNRTPASFAGNIFKAKFLKNRLFLDKNDNKLKFIWTTYHGARFEGIGRGYFEDMNMYDVNSLYPFSMVKSPLNFTNAIYKQMSLDDIENGFVGFCCVDFNYNEDTMYPCLPVRSEKLTFPLSGVSFCTSFEVVNALKQGVNINHIHAIGWEPDQEDIDHPFVKYVDYMYKQKQHIAKLIEEAEMDSDIDELLRLKIQYLKLKLLLNTPYGKLAQRNDVYDLDEEKNVEIAGSMFKPDFASLITGYSRKVIHDYMVEFDSLYCDTDSIITKKKIENDYELGGMKCEYEDVDFAVIRSKVYFGIENDSVVKAAKHGFRIPKQSAYELLKQAGNNNFVEYECKRMTKSLESIRSTRPSHMKPRKWVSDTFRITLDEDGKRIFDKKLTTAEELLSDQTMSRPLENVISIY